MTDVVFELDLPASLLLSTLIKELPRGRAHLLLDFYLEHLFQICVRQNQRRRGSSPTASAQFRRQRLPLVGARVHGGRSRQRWPLVELLTERLHILPPPFKRLHSRARHFQIPKLAPRVLADTRCARTGDRRALHKECGEERLRKAVFVRLEQRKVARCFATRAVVLDEVPHSDEWDEVDVPPEPVECQWREWERARRCGLQQCLRTQIVRNAEHA